MPSSSTRTLVHGIPLALRRWSRCFGTHPPSDTNATSDAFASADDVDTYTWANAGTYAATNYSSNAGTYAATNYSSDAESLNTPDTDADAAPDDTGTDAAPDDTGTDAWTYS